jgi:hypothetical protein
MQIRPSSSITLPWNSNGSAPQSSGASICGHPTVGQVLEVLLVPSGINGMGGAGLEPATSRV